jgi:hypothetical protein
MNRSVTVFYANLVYGNFTYGDGPGQFFDECGLRDLPDGCYLKFHSDMEVWWPGLWYLQDLTPVLPDDVPKELRLLTLLIT